MRNLFKSPRQTSLTKQALEDLRPRADPSSQQSPETSSTNGSPPPSYMLHDSALKEPINVDGAPINFDFEAAFSNLTLSAIASKTPDRDECIAHLKLLECFKHLREDISSRNGLFGIHDGYSKDSLQEVYDKIASEATSENEKREKYLKTTNQIEKTLESLRDKRWAIYVARAASRYEKWWKSVPNPGRDREPDSVQSLRRLRVGDIEADHGLETLMGAVIPCQWTADCLPPIDVLMVWHSHRLNPRIYLEDCLRHGRIHLWHGIFPWTSIDPCIHNTTFEYDANPASTHYFSKMTTLAWLNEVDQMTEDIICFYCEGTIHCPWTTLNNSLGTGWSVDAALARGQQEVDRGLSSKDFEAKCGLCGRLNNHNTMRLKKFYDDSMDLLKKDMALPGTILTLDGRAITWSKATNTLDPRTFPNRLVKIAAISKFSTIHRLDTANVDLVRQVIEDAIGNKDILSITVSGVKKDRLQRTERVAVRRMLSRYWENSSPFGIDLTGAVIRQGTFIDKMHSINWLHSPALQSTVDRLVMRYERFLALMRSHPGKILVPTLDIDLAWHTHQLACKSYYDYTTAVIGRFVDHDDKIAEGRLSNAFTFTCKIYRKKYKEEYSECNCWYCAAIREGTKGLIFSHHPQGVPGASTDASRGPHLSAHGSVPGDLIDQIETSRTAKVVEAWSRAAQEKRRKKGLLQARDASNDGNRDSATSPYTTGGLYFFPMPYGAPICDPNMYSSNPACMSSSRGAPGSCVAGTCGGVVAAGSCAGAGGGCGGGYGGETSGVDGGACGGASGGGGGGDSGGGSGGGCGGGGCGGCGGCG